MRVQPCDGATRRGRLRKAEQFIVAGGMIRELADEESDVADAYVTLCVHAGIAAADVICCSRLGEYAQGEKHNDAVGLLRKADPEVSMHLSALLSLKTKSGYSHAPVTADEVKRATRAAEALIEGARRASATAGA